MSMIKPKFSKIKVSVLEPNLLVNYLEEDANYFDKRPPKTPKTCMEAKISSGVK